MYVKYLQSASDIKLADLVVVGDVLFKIRYIVGSTVNVLGYITFGLVNVTDTKNVLSFDCTSDSKFVVWRDLDHQTPCGICGGRHVRTTNGMTCISCGRMFQTSNIWDARIINVVMETLEKEIKDVMEELNAAQDNLMNNKPLQGL